MTQDEYDKIIRPGMKFGEFTIGAYTRDPSDITQMPGLYPCNCSCGLSVLWPAERILDDTIMRSCGWSLNDPTMPHNLSIEPWTIWVDLRRTLALVLQAMDTDGGKKIILDSAFLNKHGIAFIPIDPRHEITDLQFWGFIRKQGDGWMITARGRKWLNNEIRVASLIELTHGDKMVVNRFKLNCRTFTDALNTKEPSDNA